MQPSVVVSKILIAVFVVLVIVLIVPPCNRPAAPVDLSLIKDQKVDEAAYKRKIDSLTRVAKMRADSLTRLFSQLRDTGALVKKLSAELVSLNIRGRRLQEQSDKNLSAILQNCDSIRDQVDVLAIINSGYVGDVDSTLEAVTRQLVNKDSTIKAHVDFNNDQQAFLLDLQRMVLSEHKRANRAEKKANGTRLFNNTLMLAVIFFIADFFFDIIKD